MFKLAKPPQEVINKVLSDVGFEDRLVGIKMTRMGGTTQYSLYSFQEAVNFLHFDQIEDLSMPGSKGSIGYIDLQALKQWVGKVMGDKGLAEALDAAIGNEDHYRNQAIAVKDLMEKRLSQCKNGMKVENLRG